MTAVSAQEYLDILARRSMTRPVPLPSATTRSDIVELCRRVEEPEWPPDLVARPCREPAALWHWRQLERLLNEPQEFDEASLARRAFHARWILSLAEPDTIERRPLVSILIPVYNRAGLVGEAIESALAQTYRPIEVIVIDDGSTDRVEEAIEPYRDDIRFMRQENRGVSSARNRGAALANGDYLHFLDSDNLLSNDAVDRWIGACRCVGDAEISYCPVHLDPILQNWSKAIRPEFMQPPHGGFDCPTTDLMEVVVRRHPFLMLDVLIPRCLFLETGGFDERLRWGEDTRYWFTLGLRGTKVVGLRGRRNHARPSPTGLSQSPRPEGNGGRWGLLCALDVLESPDHWLHFPEVARAITKNKNWHWIGSSDEPLTRKSRERLLSLVEDLGCSRRMRGLSPRPLLSICRTAIRESEQRLGDLGEATSYHRRFVAAVDQALVKAAPVSQTDVEYWLPDRPDSILEAEFLVSLHLLTRGRDGLGSISPGSAFWSELDRVAATPQPEALPGEDVVGRPCSSPALPFHCSALANRLTREEWRESNCDRAAYHAAWILRLLAPYAEATGPLVSIVIPAYNRTDVLKEAVASCFDQTHARIEIVVVDDGSTETLEEALQPWAGRLRLFHQKNQGAAAARNLGIRRARGELIHFLDCDDLLVPDAIERKLQALHRIPDAELVFSGARQTGDRSPFEGQPLRYLEAPVGGEGCPTHDLMSVVVKRYPFLTSTILIPRWILIEAGLFDETLRRGQDSELFFRLGLRDTKTIAVSGRLTTRRVDSGSLSARPASGADHARVAVTQVLHMMKVPEKWGRNSIAAIRRLFDGDIWAALSAKGEDDLKDLRSALLDAVEQFGAEPHEASDSLPLFLDQFRDELRKAANVCPEMSAAPFYAHLLGRIERVLA